MNGVYRRVLGAGVVLITAVAVAGPARADDAAPDLTAPMLVSSGVDAPVTNQQRMRFSWSYLDPEVAGDTTSGIDHYDLQTQERYPGATSFGAWVDHPKIGAATSFEAANREDFDECFRVRAWDRAGNGSDWSPVACSVIDWTLPAGTTASAPRVVTATTLVFAYRFTDLHGIASYDVEYREAPMGTGIRPWTHPAGWYATSATSFTRRAAPGSDTCFHVRARDRAGNVTPWSEQQCQAAPLDDTALVANGAVRRVATGFPFHRPGQTSWQFALAPSGQASTMITAGSSLTSPVARTSQVVIGARLGPAQGDVDVYVGARYLGPMAFYAIQNGWGEAYLQPTSILGGQLRLVRRAGARTVTVDWVAFLQQ